MSWGSLHHSPRAYGGHHVCAYPGNHRFSSFIVNAFLSVKVFSVVHTQGSLLFADSLIDSNKINSKVQSESRLTLLVVFCFGLCFVFRVLCFVFRVFRFVFDILWFVCFVLCEFCFVILLFCTHLALSDVPPFKIRGPRGGRGEVNVPQRKRVVFESKTTQVAYKSHWSINIGKALIHFCSSSSSCLNTFNDNLPLNLFLRNLIQKLPLKKRQDRHLGAPYPDHAV